MLPYPSYWSSEFSPSGRYLYVSGSTTPSTLWQFDTWAPNIAASKTLIWQTNFPPYTAGALKRGPDNKIYMSCAWSDSSGNFNYPYDSTMYYTENMNLSVINSPDSAGLACDFQPWSFYLGGKRTYWGLPNNPDYDLPALAGSPCDTLVGINDGPQAIGCLNVFYHTAWEKAFINASNLKGKTGKLLVYDMQGKVVHSEPLKIQNGYYTRDLSMIGRADGVYLVVIETEQERLVKKVLID
ncbi:MAG: T9SS type A sorting domain-containing protein [Bacteroidetes bacterium]|nr:T9SS type A sorting domain-containing protein [Bacteroidota bacterium]